MFQTQRPNFGLRFKTFIVMATICPLGRPLGWKNKKNILRFFGEGTMEKTKINIGKKNAKNRYLKSLWGGPHGENEKKIGKTKKIFEESLGRAPWKNQKTIGDKKKMKSLWGGPHGENQKKWKNKKTKKHQYSETLGLPFPIPKTSVFFSCCFSKFFVFFQVFFFSKFFFWLFA